MTHTVRQITTFSPNLALSERDKRRIWFILDKQIDRLQRGHAKDLFEKLKEIKIVASPSEDPVLTHMAEKGRAFAGVALPDKVVVVYDISKSGGFFFSTTFNAWTEVPGHELAHFAIERFYEPTPDYRVHAQNLVHVAYNMGTHQSTTTHVWMPDRIAGGVKNWLKRLALSEVIRIKHYNLGDMIADTYKIKRMVIDRTAPIRTSHPYWLYSTN